MIALTIREDGSVRNEIVRPTHPVDSTCDSRLSVTPQEGLPSQLTIHVGNEEPLLERVAQSSPQTELVLAPVELHQRNIQRRLRELQTPKNGLQVTDPTAVGKRALEAVNRSTTKIDRIDRLSMIRSILSDGDVSITSPAVSSDAETVEQIRTVVENVTGFHPERLDTLWNVVDDLPAPIGTDGDEIVTAATAIERALRGRTSKSLSGVEIVRRATREILASDGEAWSDAFPDVDCVSFVGVSSVSAAHIDLLHAVLASVAVPVHIHFRRGTGSFLSRRVPQLLDVVTPGAVVFEHD